MRTATIRKAKGGVRIIDLDTGRIVRETNAQGRQIVRVNVGRTASSKGRVATQQQLARVKQETKLRQLAEARKKAAAQRAQQKRIAAQRDKARKEQARKQAFQRATLSGRTSRAVTKKALESTSPRRTVRTIGYGRVKPAVKTPKARISAFNDQAKKEIDKLQQQVVKNKIGKKSTGQLEAKIFAVSLASNIGSNVQGFIELPATLKYFKNNPKEIKKIPAEIDRSVRRFGTILRTSPSQAMGIVAGELLLFKGTSSAINRLSKLKNTAITRLDPRFKGRLKVGNTLKIGSTKLEVVGKIPKSTLKAQVNKAGRTVDAISSQADSLLTLGRRKRIVRKPIPNEASFNKATKDLLKKFDEGKLSPKEVVKLDNMIKKQGAKGLLERSGFADPTGKIRPSRLGVVGDTKARLLDYISGNVSFKSARPQILFFRGAKVQSFPKNKIFDSIKKKLRSNKPLTQLETEELLKFQLARSGKFKPVGFLSGESEITIPAGELLRRKKVVGVTIIKGKRVNIVETDFYTPKGSTKTLLEKWEKGTISAVENRKLSAALKRETGFNYGTSYSASVRAKYVSPRRLTSKTSSRLLSKARSFKKPSKAVSRKAVSRRAKSKASSRKVSKPVSKKISKPVSRASSKKSPAKSPRKSVAKSPPPRTRVPVSPPARPPIPRKFLKRRLSKKEKESIKKWFKKQKPKYRPSLAAILFNFTAYKVPKSITGFEIRPIIIKRKKD